MSPHKIQSSSVPALNLSLPPTPKCLGHITHEWAPSSFVISFKLETDPDILFAKATKVFSSFFLSTFFILIILSFSLTVSGLWTRVDHCQSAFVVQSFFFLLLLRLFFFSSSSFLLLFLFFFSFLG